MQRQKYVIVLLTVLLCFCAGCHSQDPAPETSTAGRQTDTAGAEDRGETLSDSSVIHGAELENAVSRQVGLARSLFEQEIHYDADRILRGVIAAGVDDSAVFDLWATNLLRWAEKALGERDSTQFAACLLRLAEGPLPESLLPVVGGMLGLGYRIAQVTDNVEADYAPRFFAHGRTIVYFSRLEREALEYPGFYSVRYQAQICTVGIDGENPMVISDGRASDFYPDISPDGRYIVCQRAEGDTLKEEWAAAMGSYLYLYDLHTGQGRRLGEDGLYGRWPRFAPAGGAVVFQTFNLGPNGWISTIDLETGELMPRYRSSSVFDFDRPLPFFPSFFPDGARLVFQAGVSRSKLIYVADSFGRDLVCLTPDTVNTTHWISVYDSREVSERHPSVSPDGQNIVFVSKSRHDDELFIRRPDATTRRRITFDGYDKGFPAYSPDGRYIAYGAKRKGYPDTDYEIYILDLATAASREQMAARARKLAGRFGIGR